MKQRLIIAGSREFNDYEYLENAIDRYFRKFVDDKTDVTIISGTARGTDTMGERYARSHGIDLIQCPANWGRLGKAAGYIRNEEMAILSMSDGCQGVLIAFWDGVSRGTKHMIDLANKHGLIVHVFKVGNLVR